MKWCVISLFGSNLLDSTTFKSIGVVLVFTKPVYGKFKAVIPANWVAVEEENIISLYEPIKGVGALQFSLFNIESAVNILLEKKLAELLENRFNGDITVRDNCAQAVYLHTQEKKFWRYWLFQKGDLVVFGSYNSDEDDKEIESAVVQGIVNSAIGI